MRSDLEETQKELKRVQEELAVANFTQESKVGRQLMAKCRSLATENEELGRELVEGRVGFIRGRNWVDCFKQKELRAEQVSENEEQGGTLWEIGAEQVSENEEQGRDLVGGRVDSRAATLEPVGCKQRSRPCGVDGVVEAEGT
eukprot:1145536-Pelagomonas_calceolata.AAC.13